MREMPQERHEGAVGGRATGSVASCLVYPRFRSVVSAAAAGSDPPSGPWERTGWLCVAFCAFFLRFRAVAFLSPGVAFQSSPRCQDLLSWKPGSPVRSLI